MMTIRTSRKLVAGISAVTIMVGGSYLWSHAATSCTCLDLRDINSYYKKQVVQQNEYKKQQEGFKIIESATGEKYDWSPSRNDTMMKDITDALNNYYDYFGVQTIAADTSALTCSIASYRWVDPAGGIHSGYPNLCLKELVDVHEQIHIDECNRASVPPLYKWLKTMEETAAEEIKATQTGMDYVLKLKLELERQFCCAVPISQFKVPSLKTIIANLFATRKST